MTVALLGYFGMDNFGDDLFCAATASHASDLFPGHEALIAGPRLPEVRVGYAYPATMPKAWFQSEGLGGQIVRGVVGMRVFLGAERLVLAGGSVLGSLHGVRRLQSRLDFLLPKTWEALGVSIGPFGSDEDAHGVQALLQRFSRITVRDRASFTRALDLDLKAQMSGDLAALYSSPKRGGVGSMDEHVVLVPCVAADDRVWFELVDAIGHVTKRVSVLSANANSVKGDDQVARRTAEALRRRHVEAEVLAYPDLGVAGSWDLIGSAAAVISGRLHGAIAAYLQGVPFALLEYHEKCTEFLLDVGQADANRVASGKGHELARSLLSEGVLPVMSPESYRDRARQVLLGAE